MLHLSPESSLLFCYKAHHDRINNLRDVLALLVQRKIGIIVKPPDRQIVYNLVVTLGRLVVFWATVRLV